VKSCLLLQDQQAGKDVEEMLEELLCCTNKDHALSLKQGKDLEAARGQVYANGFESGYDDGYRERVRELSFCLSGQSRPRAYSNSSPGWEQKNEDDGFGESSACHGIRLRRVCTGMLSDFMLECSDDFFLFLEALSAEYRQLVKGLRIEESSQSESSSDLESQSLVESETVLPTLLHSVSPQSLLAPACYADSTLSICSFK
jgi:hypothetical protein